MILDVIELLFIGGSVFLAIISEVCIINTAISLADNVDQLERHLAIDLHKFHLHLG